MLLTKIYSIFVHNRHSPLSETSAQTILEPLVLRLLILGTPVFHELQLSSGRLGHDFFICWITLHFQEFQSAAIGKKIKIKIELKPKI